MDLEEMRPVYDERKKPADGVDVPPIPLTKACCGTCSYGKQQSPVALTCRKYAPRPSIGQKTPIAAWPIVETHDWCGEFKLRES